MKENIATRSAFLERRTRIAAKIILEKMNDDLSLAYAEQRSYSMNIWIDMYTHE